MVEVLFYTAVLTKQFYLLPSGSIGIADLFFALSGALALIMAWRSGKKNLVSGRFSLGGLPDICSCH